MLVVLTAGTADLAVAQEAATTARALGVDDVRVVADVGVAGLQRLLSRLDAIREADVLLVVAGMDGALPSVVAGLVDAPVVAVPTSIGYGAAMGGLSPLAAALNSCATGVTAVNIDNAASARRGGGEDAPRGARAQKRRARGVTRAAVVYKKECSTVVLRVTFHQKSTYVRLSSRVLDVSPSRVTSGRSSSFRAGAAGPRA